MDLEALRVGTVFVQEYISLTKLMVLHDLPLSTVTKNIAFDQRDLHSTSVFERAMDRRC